ncbi:hypothetical protein [Streptomyces sp. NPDC059008]|uniref:hypothetical protein n=1 Tax=Streptomyces sp. NPDC059008 TaxID=3346693 RepID=UPI00369626A4
MSDTETGGGGAAGGGTKATGGAAGTGREAEAADAGEPGGAADAGAMGGAAACPVAIRQALATHTTMTLAYVDEDGPQACAVLYATEAPDAPNSAGSGYGDGAVAGPGVVADEGGDAGAGDDAGAGAGPGDAPGTVLTAGPSSDPVLYFVTATTTRHGRALAEPGARVAFTAQRDGQEWSGLTGLQGRGHCRPLTGAERAAGWRIYTERFPFVEASDRLRAALERTTLWELRPDWLRLIDNGQGFGHKEEWRRPDAP